MPIFVGLNAIILFCGISTNMLPQVRWRAHRYMLGQPVGFFQNDFAGRLANRVMQTGVAVDVLNSAALFAVIGPALALWSHEVLSIGEVAVAIAMALRLNSMSGWIMWMTVRVFEHFGTIKGGERVGLVGPSGAGKSTLVHNRAHGQDYRDGRWADY